MLYLLLSQKCSEVRLYQLHSFDAEPSIDLFDTHLINLQYSQFTVVLVQLREFFTRILRKCF